MAEMQGVNANIFTIETLVNASHHARCDRGVHFVDDPSENFPRPTKFKC